MKRVRVFAVIFISLIIILLIFASKFFREESSEKLPNVILIMVDALRPDHLGCYGYLRDTSPNIDGLARDGVKFTQVFVQAPSTMPSVTSVRTSLYPKQHQAWNMHGEEGLKGIDDSLVTLTEIVNKNGYKTVGVVSNGYLDSAFGFGQGYDEYYETWKLPEAQNSDPDAQYYKHLAEARHTNQIVLPWIEKNKHKKFFMLLFYIDPHDPYAPPPPFNTKYTQKEYDGWLKGNADGRHLTRVIFGKDSLSEQDLNYIKDLYDGEISYLDSQIGKLIDKLAEENILDNTIIIFTADHGEEFMEHGGVLHGYALYNEHIRVPLIITGPRIPQLFKSVDCVVRSIDIMPTVLDLLDIPIPDQVQGESLVPLLDGSSINREDRIVFSRQKLEGAWGKTIKLASIQKEGWKLIVDQIENKRELYYVRSDTWEQNNLIDENPGKAEELSDILDYFLNLPPMVKLEGEKEPIEVDKSTIENLESLGYIQ